MSKLLLVVFGIAVFGHAQTPNRDLNSVKPTTPTGSPTAKIETVTISPQGKVTRSSTGASRYDPGTTQPQVLTYAWGNVGCDVNPGGYDEQEVRFSIPPRTCSTPTECSGGGDFCNYSVTVTHSNNNGTATHRVTEVRKDGISVWYKCVGGFPIGGGGSDHKLAVTLTSTVPDGLPAATRKQLGCTAEANVGKHIVACIKSGSSQKPNIISCYKGPGQCHSFTDIKSEKCVATDDDAKWYQVTQCTGSDFIYVPNSPQCRWE